MITIILTTILNITSFIFIANILPNMKFSTSVFNPVVTDVTATTIAKADDEIIATILSLFIFLLSPIFNKIIDVIITIGIETNNGDVIPSDVATVNTPNPTCDKPITDHTISL